MAYGLGIAREYKQPENVLAAQRRYRERHREELRARRRKYWREHREAEIEKSKLYFSNPIIKEQRKLYDKSREEKRKPLRPQESRRYYEKHKEKIADKNKVYYMNNLHIIREKQRDSYRKRMDDPAYKQRVYGNCKEYQKRTRSLVIERYGGACACCHESNYEFLCIDHVNGGGNKHRKALGNRGGTAFYLWLKRNGFPEGFQVLCYNCNMAKGCYGACPHQKGRVI